MYCSVSGCSQDEWSSGLCSKHYNRLRKTGTVEDGPRARSSLQDRFWKKVKVCGPNECWPWIGKSRIKGYGVIGSGGRGGGKLLSHRAAWLLTHGRLPENISGYHGAVVMHVCDNRLCCNPSHLRVGTQSENVSDMDRKGRRKSKSRQGESHHNSRFTDDDIRYIRSSSKRNTEIAQEYGCARQVIGGIRRRVSWKHIK